jgi:hypothetical protein
VDLVPHLLAAGFTPGGERTVRTGPVTGTAAGDRFRKVWDHDEKARVTELAALRAAGLWPVTTVTTHRWTPETAPPADRPVRMLSLRDCEESAVDDLNEIVHSGLVSGTRPGEPLYWLDWHHVGFRFDPHRVGGRGPRWPGAVFPDGDYRLYLAADLRLGIFGHPWAQTLCVFGAPLLTAVGARLTALLGPPRAPRRGVSQKPPVPFGVPSPVGPS